jgi:predicted site-specific integrase-resolvase
MCFGAEYIEAALAAQGRHIVVSDAAEMKNDLVQDIGESFSGPRSCLCRPPKRIGMD